MKMVVALDFSEASEAVLKVAGDYAQRLSAEVWLIHVASPDPEFVGYEVGPDSVRDQVAQEFRREHQALGKSAEDFRRQGIHATPLLIQGETAAMILREAASVDADLILVGSHGHGAVYDFLVGSVSDALIRRSSLPVLVVPVRPRDADRPPKGSAT